MNKESTRKLLEMAYLYCWGPDGNQALRDEFRWLIIEANVGQLIYGFNKITWKD